LRQFFILPKIDIYIIDNSTKSNWNLEIFGQHAEDFNLLKIELHLIRGHGNVGYGKAQNLLLQSITSEFHIMLNPDVVLDIDCLVEGIRYMINNTRTAVVSPNAIGNDGNKQYLCKTYPALFTFLVRGFLPGSIKNLFEHRLNKYEMHNLSESTPSEDIPIVSGCFMLCRTDFLREVNGFDESYFLYFEDFDISMRLSEIGKLAYLPSMRIEHGGGHAARKGFKHILMFARSGFRFFNTHGWRFFRQD